MEVVGMFPAGDGTHVMIDVVDAPSDDGVVRRGLHPAQLTERAAATFDEMVAGLEAPIRSLLASFKGAAEGVDDIELHFGLRFTADAGAIISRVGGEANFEVVVRWKRPAVQAGGRSASTESGSPESGGP